MAKKIKSNNAKRSEFVSELVEIADAITNQNTHITVINNRELFIDGCKGIVEYCDNEITVRVGANLVTVSGCDLFIKNLSKTSLCIVGKIKNIAFCACECE